VGGNVTILLIFVRLLTIQCKCTFKKRFAVSTSLHRKEKPNIIRQQSQKCASLAAIARYVAINFTVSYLQIFNPVFIVAYMCYAHSDRSFDMLFAVVYAKLLEMVL